MSAVLERRGTAASRVPAAEAEGPLLQSVRIGFLVLRAATAVLALAWATGDCREIAPGTQAVVTRMGRIDRVAGAGLVLAWPRPFERLTTLPGPERQMQLAVVAGGTAPPAPPTGDGETGFAAAATPAPAPDAGIFLTGDGEVLRLQATLTWHIDDARAYLVARDHVEAALRRAFLAAATATAASHELDDFLSVRPERAADPRAEARRAAMRLTLADATNARLAALAAAGAPIGVAVTRIDLTPVLPAEAKSSFDAVLDAAQRADEGLATARTDAALRRQNADRARDRILTDAHAAAIERIATARADTATIAAIEARMTARDRPALIQELYRTRIGAVLRAAGQVSAIASGPAHLILPGPKP